MCKNGMKTPNGNSVNIFDKKYGATLYMLLFTSLKKTGLSSGNTAAALLIPEKPPYRTMLNKAPLLF